MPINIEAEDLLKIIKDNTVQKIFFAILIAGCAFFAGRATVSNQECIIDDVCEDIIDDRDELSRQLTEQRAECQKEKKRALEELAERLERECMMRIDEAIDHCEFSEDIHCPICISRGLCVKP